MIQLNSFRNRKIGQLWMMIVLCVGVLTAFEESSATSLEQFTSFERTEAASVVVFGNIIGTDDGSLVIEVARTIKGAVDAPKIEVLWDKVVARSAGVAVFPSGTGVVAFVNPKGGAYEPFAFPNGIYLLPPESRDNYQATVEKILKFQGAATTHEKTRILIEMLEMDNWFSQLEAVSKIGRAITYKGLNKSSFIAPVLNATKSPYPGVAINAVHVFTIITDYQKHIPALIDLLTSPNADVAETAYRALRQLARVDFGFSTEDAPEVRQSSIQKWRDWWNEAQKKQ